MFVQRSECFPVEGMESIPCDSWNWVRFAILRQQHWFSYVLKVFNTVYSTVHTYSEFRPGKNLKRTKVQYNIAE
jgi:hypothetical protein